MSRGVNKLILIGNLGADPETRYTQGGDPVTNIRIATSESWKDRNTGQQQERTEWHTVVFFKKLAEIAGEYLHKGSRVYIEGSLRTRKWQAQDGTDRYSTEIVAREMQMLDSRQGQGAPVGGYQQQPQQHGNNGSRQGQQQGFQAPPQQGGNGQAPMAFDDDIPF